MYPIFAIATLALLLTSTGCGLIQRSQEATNVEDAQPQLPRPDSQATIGTEPAPQQIQSAPKAAASAVADAPNPKLKKSRQLFDQAFGEQEDGAFLRAAELWKEFLERNVGMPGYNPAIYHYSVALFSLGRASEAVEPLKSVITNTGDTRLANDSRILLAESMIQTQKFAEALAITYEVLPNRAAEESSGLQRDRDAIGVAGAAPDLTQKIRLFTIRGRIFASLNRQDDARAALERAKALLLNSKKGQLSRETMQFLSANYAWRQIEVQALICKHSGGTPEHLSEAEFLAYVDAYYSCVAPARQLYCTILAAENEQVRVQAQLTYRQLVEAPLAFRDHLPPPSREIKKPEQRSYYESEMKTLIEKTVAERAQEFKNLPSCHAHDIF